MPRSNYQPSRIAGAIGAVNRFNPAARITGAALGRVGVSRDSIAGQVFNVGGHGIHEAMASRMAHSAAGRAVTHVAGKMAANDPIVRGIAKAAERRGLVKQGSTAHKALGLNRQAGGLAGVIEGMRKKSAGQTMTGRVKNAQFEAKHRRVHGRFV